jgi:hypothetical protein
VPNSGALDSGVPPALLLIEPTEKQVHLPVDHLIRMTLRAQTTRTLTLVHVLLGHGTVLRDLSVN